MDIVLRRNDVREAEPRWRFVMRRIGLWLTLWSERRTLATLDRRMLSDIGLTADDAALEASRTMWDVPRNREVPRVNDGLF
ncbi:MAG: DUF1127 domain-containing protein [Pseudomonadota bacterium]